MRWIRLKQALFMYESHYACHFFRLWGYAEGRSGVPMQGSLLGNMQNDFDSTFGDVCAEVDMRYFIIEFKRTRAGFAEETQPSGKLHRALLYQHLRADDRCRMIARHCHFGAYADDTDQLMFEPYAHCRAKMRSREEIVSHRLRGRQPWHELDYPAWRYDFDGFHAKVTEPDSALGSMHPEFFAKGLGVSRALLEEYVNCMYAHLQPDPSGQAILGAFNPKTQAFFAFEKDLSVLVQSLQHAFKRMQAMQAPKATPPRPGPSPRP